jgi:hypothetical protein
LAEGLRKTRQFERRFLRSRETPQPLRAPPSRSRR